MMKCSDCRLFKTSECRLNPDAKNLDYAETFACFDLDPDEESRRIRAASTGQIEKMPESRTMSHFGTIAGIVLGLIVVAFGIYFIVSWDVVVSCVVAPILFFIAAFLFAPESVYSRPIFHYTAIFISVLLAIGGIIGIFSLFMCSWLYDEFAEPVYDSTATMSLYGALLAFPSAVVIFGKAYRAMKARAISEATSQSAGESVGKSEHSSGDF